MKTMSTRELQLIELEILKDFDTFCRKHDIKYFLAGGTLLGAVRHKGFIPWDDDVDIYMPRPDYIKFNRIYDSRFTLKLPLNDSKWHFPFAKLLNMSIIIRENEFNLNTGVWIDIFPVDGWPDSYNESENYRRKRLQLELLCAARYGRFVKSKHGSLRTICKFSAIGLLRLVPGSILAHYIDRSASRNFTYEDSKFVGNTVWPGEKIIRITKDFFNDMIELPFEDSKFYAPANYDDYLVQAYGDYMKLPPISERITHKIELRSS
ncbi:MAG: LicD family protein [Bacillota bacterium]|nr:LicD family protein [Bacillota bacterium]